MPVAAFPMSLVIHFLIALTLMRIVWDNPVPDVKDVVLQIKFKKEPEPPPEPPEPVKRDVVVPEKKVKKPAPVPVKKPVEEPEPDPKPVEPPKFLEEDPLLLAELDIEGDKGREEVIGLKKRPPPGDTVKAKAVIFQGRSGEGKRVALLRGGGSDASENAVAMGLQWLTNHQNHRGGTGFWSTWRFEDKCPESDKCGGRGTDVRNFDPAMTGLALLCYLGAGHTHKQGDYCDTVRRGLRFLTIVQKEDGSFGQPHSHLMYNHSIATLAMAEAYAMTRDQTLKEPVRKAVSFISIAQQPSGGWDYKQTITGRNDTSITGWVVMALKSAAAGGIAVPWETVSGSMQHFETMTTSDGNVVYANRGVGNGRKGVGMVAVGMLCRQFLGYPRNDPIFDRMAKRMLKEPPTWEALRPKKLTESNAFNTMYYWYYATLAIYQHGGHAWDQWNGFLRDMLCGKQRQDGHSNGSWEPDGQWFGDVGGRVYSTTMGILCLEVYYRYLPIYEEGGAFKPEQILVEALRKGDQKQRLQALRTLARMEVETLPDNLREALNDTDVFIRLHACQELLRLKDHVCIPALTDLLHHQNGYVRSKAVGLLGEIDDPIIIPSLAKALSDDQTFVAEKAALLLVKITGKDFGFRTSAPLVDKRKVERQYRQWWQTNTAATQARSDPEEAPELIEGKVLAVREDVGILMVSLGKRQGLKVGDQLYVSRAEDYIGTVKVKEVLEDELAAAQIMADFTVQPIRQGDLVRNRAR